MKVRTSSLIGTALLVAAAFAPADAQNGLETFATLGREAPPGNVAVTPDDRVIVSLHQFFAPALRVVEVRGDGSVAPFPNADWNTPPDGSGIGLVSVLGIRADARGIVWMLDNGGGGAVGRLVGWDTQSDRLHKIVTIAPPATTPDSFLNDLAIDQVRNAVVIADTAVGGNSALVVVDLETGHVQRRLQGDRSVVAEDLTMIVEGKTLMLGDTEARVGVNPITIDAASEWVYFGPMTGLSLYRVRSRDLLDTELTEEALSRRVERYGPKPISDGISIDIAGNIYVSDIGSEAVGVLAPDRSYRVLHHDKGRLRWPNAMAAGPEGMIYVAANQLHRSAPLNRGEDLSRPPFHLLRFPALGPTAVGR